MKLLLLAAGVFGAALGFAALSMQDPGYVVLLRAPYTVRMPLAFFVLALLASFFLLYALLGLLGAAWRVPSRWRAWRKRRAHEHAQRLTMQGYAGLIEGEWRHAEQKLLSGGGARAPLLNYLGAAYAAQQRGDSARRERTLDIALAHYPRQQLAIGLTRARLQYQAGEIAAARALLETLRRIAPGNAAAARLLADAYRELGEWRALIDLLPALSRLGVFAREEFRARERQAYARCLATAPGGDDGARIKKTFQLLPRAARRDAHVRAEYARRLIQNGSHQTAEQVLRRALSREWSAELIYAYGMCEARAAEQMKNLLQWKKKYGDHPDITLALARLHRREGDVETARRMFADALANGGREIARAELGALLEAGGDYQAALACMRRRDGALEDAHAHAHDSPGALPPLR